MEFQSLLVLGAVLIGVSGILFTLIFSKSKQPTPEVDPTAKEGSDQRKKQQQTKKKEHKTKEPVLQVKHPLEICRIKDHGDSVNCVGFTPDGKYLITGSSDRIMKLWLINSIAENSRKHFRVNTDFDHALHMCISQDSKYIFLYMGDSKKVFVYGILDEKKSQPGKHVQLIKQFPQITNKQVISFDLSRDSKFLLFAYGETEVALWSVKEQKLLQKLDTKQMKNYQACMNSDASYFGVAAFTTNVNIWEILKTPEAHGQAAGQFSGTQKAFSLYKDGHKNAVYGLSFSKNRESGRDIIATIGKDGTLKLWNTDVRIKEGEDVHCVSTVNLNSPKPLEKIKYSPDGSCIVITAGYNIIVCAGNNGNLLQTIENAHKGTITSIAWSADSKTFATSSEDKSVVLWKNPAI